MEIRNVIPMWNLLYDSLNHKKELIKNLASQGNLDCSVFPFPCWVADINYDVCQWNYSMEDLYGYSKNEVMGKNIFDLFIKDDKRIVETAKSLYERMISGKISGTYEIAVDKDKDGNDLLLFTVPFSVTQGDEKYFVEMAVDIGKYPLLKDSIDKRYLRDVRVNHRHEFNTSFYGLMCYLRCQTMRR